MKAITPIKLFSGRATRYLSESIAKEFGMELGEINIHEFSDGEFQPYYLESVRGCTVFIIQSTFPPQDNLMELLLLIDAAKRASAYKIVAVIPYLGLARQDRKDRPRTSIGAKLVADLLTASGVDRVMTMDLHAPPIQGFFNIPVDHLYSSSLFVPYLEKLNLKNLTVAAPDMGGAKRANAYSRFMKTPMVICHKTRSMANVVDEITVIGEVEGKDVVIVDDMIDTAGTITTAAKVMKEYGASSVRVAATHPVLSGPAIDRINESPIQEVIVSDSIPLGNKKSDKITVIPIGGFLADVIGKVYNYQSISSNFII